ISERTFFIGDGYYTNPDGSYYMHTDAGFMRNVLLSGIVGLLLVLICSLVLIWGVWVSSKRKFEDVLFSLSLVMVLAILHGKGEVFGYLIIWNVIILFVYFGQKVCSKNGAICVAYNA